MQVSAEDDRADAYSETVVETWELTATEWAALATLLELLSPIKVLTKELEVESYPIIHAAGRALIWLALLCPELDEANAVGDNVRQTFVDAAKDKLLSFLDDPAYIRELAIAGFFDPRFKVPLGVEELCKEQLYISTVCAHIYTACHNK